MKALLIVWIISSVIIYLRLAYLAKRDNEKLGIEILPVVLLGPVFLCMALEYLCMED